MASSNFVCGICDDSFQDVTELMQHLQRHKDEQASYFNLIALDN